MPRPNVDRSAECNGGSTANVWREASPALKAAKRPRTLVRGFHFASAVFLGLLIRPLGGNPAGLIADPIAGESDLAEQGFQWKMALIQSSLFLGIQHTGRLVEEKTRRELKGPFWSDYLHSVSTIHTWNDGDSITTNYLGHPIMGAVAGYIQIVNDPVGRRLEFEISSTQYWRSRLKAFAWAAAYSTQFEFGPISEASIGNVGKHPPTMAVVDLVVTPIGGFALIVLEDYLDKRFIDGWESRTSNTKIRLYRIALNPSRSLTNLIRFKRPWYRDNRPAL